MNRLAFVFAVCCALLLGLAFPTAQQIPGNFPPGVFANTAALSPASGPAPTCASVLPGLILNLDASISASVHLSGSNVTQWDDQSTGASNFVQATGARQPTYSATGFNSVKPGVTTVAANAQFVQNTTFPLNSATISIFVVHTFAAGGVINNGFSSFVAAGQANDFGNNSSFIMSSPINNATTWRFTSNAYDDFNHLTATTANSPQTIGWVFDGTNGTGYLDFAGDTPAARVATFGGTTGLLAFGTRPWNGNTPSFGGVYAEIIMTTSALSSGQRGTLHTCLSTKWGVP